LESFVIILVRRFEARGVISMVMSWPVSSSVRGLRMVLVVDAEGAVGGGSGVEVEMVSMEGGFARKGVEESVRRVEGMEIFDLEARARCWVWEAKRADGV
jgi:hypothetical protein